MREIENIGVRRTWCLNSTLNFTRYFFKNCRGRKFIVGEHHVKIANALDRVYSGEVKNLIINIAPRYSKTELAVKNFIARGLAINPAARFIHLSYSDDLALDNSEEIKEIIKSSAYTALFPGVEVKKYTDSKKKWYTTAGGGVYATSTAGQVTGFGAGIVEEDEEARHFLPRTVHAFGGAIIIDDPIKPEDARSIVTRDRVNARFDSTIRSRVNSRNTPIIIIMQRIDPLDLCGHLLKIEGNIDDGGTWHVLSLPAIIEEDGERKALWPFKHTLEELKKLREVNDSVFDSQFMQNPQPSGDLALPMPELSFYDPSRLTPDAAGYTALFVDPSDRGDDFCAILARVMDGNVYIEQAICNNKGLDENIPATVDMIVSCNPSIVMIEGNGGWVQTARDIRSEVWKRSTEIDIRVYKEKLNKEEKIAAQAYFIKRKFLFRKDWEDDPGYRRALSTATTYVKTVRDQEDDSIDVLSNISAYLRRNNLIDQE